MSKLQHNDAHEAHGIGGAWPAHHRDVNSWGAWGGKGTQPYRSPVECVVHHIQIHAQPASANPHNWGGLCRGAAKILLLFYRLWGFDEVFWIIGGQMSTGGFPPGVILKRPCLSCFLSCHRPRAGVSLHSKTTGIASTFLLLFLSPSSVDAAAISLARTAGASSAFSAAATAAPPP
jgi:hypothetical protein